MLFFITDYTNSLHISKHFIYRKIQMYMKKCKLINMGNEYAELTIQMQLTTLVSLLQFFCQFKILSWCIWQTAKPASTGSRGPIVSFRRGKCWYHVRIVLIIVIQGFQTRTGQGKKRRPRSSCSWIEGDSDQGHCHSFSIFWAHYCMAKNIMCKILG